MQAQKGQKKNAAPEQKKKGPSQRARKLSRAPVRLWAKAVFLGFRRGKVTQNEHQALIKVQGVNNSDSQFFYNGKRVAYIYRGGNAAHNTRYRVIWGRISRGHGRNGVMIARFRRNLPPQAMGSILRVFLYPQRTSFDMAACLQKAAQQEQHTPAPAAQAPAAAKTQTKAEAPKGKK